VVLTLRSMALITATVLLFPVTAAAAPTAPRAAAHALRERDQAASRIARQLAPTGKILTTADGGEIFGFDIDQDGTDGVLASARTINSNGENRISVETFDQTSGKITKSFAVARTKSDYVLDGIFAGDIALVDHEVVPRHSIYAIRHYLTMDPVTSEQFTGRWTPPVKDISVLLTAENQATSTSVVYAIELKNDDAPILVVSDVANNTFGKVIKLDPNQFWLNNGPQLAQDTVNSLAVMATSPSSGGAGGPPPKIATVDLGTGALKEFGGVPCPGLAGCGYANGIAYDSNTGIACTTTELDGGVEFYTVADQTGFHELLPNDGGQTFAGTTVASDPVNQLFLVAQPHSSTAQSGSSIQVYGENGDLVESINGLNFTDAGSLVLPIKVAINPLTRTGWVNGPQVSQLTQFSY
jgi:hypothetical protein